MKGQIPKTPKFLKSNRGLVKDVAMFPRICIIINSSQFVLQKGGNKWLSH